MCYCAQFPCMQKACKRTCMPALVSSSVMTAGSFSAISRSKLTGIATDSKGCDQAFCST